MKKLAFIVFAFSASTAVFGQIDSSGINDNIRYCAQMKDGILVVVDDDNQEISSDVKTDNGTVIRSNGNIVMRDGVTTVLKEGECVNTQGVVVRLTNTNTNRKETESKVTVKQKP
jgi:hypothetical protein